MHILGEMRSYIVSMRSYFALVVKIVPNEQRTDGHAHLFVGPFDALRPAMPLRLDAEQDLAKVNSLLEAYN